MTRGSQGRRLRAQVNAQTCCVAYDTGETEELPVDDVIRDGIMSLGWQRARPTSGASSGRRFSGSGAHRSPGSPVLQGAG